MSPDERLAGFELRKENLLRTVPHFKDGVVSYGLVLSLLDHDESVLVLGGLDGDDITVNHRVEFVTVTVGQVEGFLQYKTQLDMLNRCCLH